MIHVGFSEGKSVDIPLLHTIVAAQTRYGKSTTIRAMMQHIPEGYKTLALDVKDPRDFEGAGTEVPIYVEDKTDPLMLKQLLEQESHLWLRREFPELIDLCKEGDTFENVYERVNKRMEEKVHPVVKDRLKVLQLLLRKLVENMAKTKLSDVLELPAKNNVMNLSKAPSEIKQLGVYSVVKWVLTNLNNVVLIIDELPDFAPQAYRTPSKSMITQAIRKGGAKGIWLWLSGQTMTGVDKQVLKQAMIWILGHQREINEAKRTLDQIPFKTGLKVEDIMTLPVGHFIVCTDEGAYITYVQPEGLEDIVARKVSLGELSVNDVSNLLQLKEGDDLVWKEKYEALKTEYDQYVEATKERLKNIQGELSSLRDKLKETDRKVETLEKDAGAVAKIREGLLELIPLPTTETIDLEHKGLIVNVHHEGEKEVKMSTATKEGQIMYCIINEMPKTEEGFAQIDLIKKLLEHGWNIGQSTVSSRLSTWANKGLLIKTEKGYRLPKLVKFNVKKAEE